MNTKVLIGGIIGGVVLFILGFLLYGQLMAGMLAKCMSCQRPMEELNFLCLGIGNLFIGWAIAYILSKWSGTPSFGNCSAAGAIVGLLLAIGFDSISYATATVFTSITCIVYDVIIVVVMWAITAGVIGWWLGRK